jgi:hypothetical protein
VPRARLSRVALLVCGLTALLVAAGASGRGAVVEVNNLVLRADGGFQPRTLPRSNFKAIEFAGHASIASKDGSRPVALRRAVIDFDADGRLSPRGLPSCAPEQVANATTEEARALCAGAIVGRGRIEAVISLSSGPIEAGSPLTIFNGPRQDGLPTAVLHAHITSPGTQTFAILVPIERIRGEFRYRVTLDLPPIAAGLGSLSLIEVEIGRRFSFEGKRRSYVSARCRDGILRTRGYFAFEDGTVIAGAVEKFCRALPGR